MAAPARAMGGAPSTATGGPAAGMTGGAALRSPNGAPLAPPNRPALDPAFVPLLWREHLVRHALEVFIVAPGSPDHAAVGWLRTEATSLAADADDEPIDGASTLWLIKRGDRPACTLRLTYHREALCDASGPCERHRRLPFREIAATEAHFCRSAAFSADLLLVPLLLELAWQKALREGIRLVVADVDVRRLPYYRMLGYHVVPGSDFVDPRRGAPGRVAFLAADPRNPGALARLFGTCANPLRVDAVHTALAATRRDASSIARDLP